MPIACLVSVLGAPELDQDGNEVRSLIRYIT